MEWTSHHLAPPSSLVSSKLLSSSLGPSSLSSSILDWSSPGAWSLPSSIFPRRGFSRQAISRLVFLCRVFSRRGLTRRVFPCRALFCRLRCATASLVRFTTPTIKSIVGNTTNGNSLHHTGERLWRLLGRYRMNSGWHLQGSMLPSYRWLMPLNHGRQRMRSKIYLNPERLKFHRMISLLTRSGFPLHVSLLWKRASCKTHFHPRVRHVYLNILELTASSNLRRIKLIITPHYTRTRSDMSLSTSNFRATTDTSLAGAVTHSDFVKGSAFVKRTAGFLAIAVSAGRFVLLTSTVFDGPHCCRDLKTTSDPRVGPSCLPSSFTCYRKWHRFRVSHSYA